MPTAIHARRRLLVAACPRMYRVNVGHRPVIHSPHLYPSRTAGFRRPRRPWGCAAYRPPARPALRVGLSKGQSKRDLFSEGAMRHRPGAVLERARPPSRGAHPRGRTAQSLIPATGRTRDRQL